MKKMVVSDFIFAFTILCIRLHGSIFMLFYIRLQMVQYPDTCYFVSVYKLHTTFIIFLFIIIIYEKLITIYLNII